MKPQRGESLIDIISIGCMLAFWIIPPAVFSSLGWKGGWWWLAWWVWLALSLGTIELTSKIVTGKTISNHFWRWSAQVDAQGRYVNLWKAVGTLILWTLAWGILIVHLAWKLFTGAKYDSQGNKIQE